MPHIPFRPYMHVDRLNVDETKGILQGHCVISTKIDGTNTVIWLDDGVLKVGNRTCVLMPEKDNDHCLAYVESQPMFKDYLQKHPTHILYGEFLVRNHIKTYDPTAWHKVYVFDVYDTEREAYLPYETYAKELEAFHIPFIPPISIVDNPTQEDLEDALENCNFLNQGDPGEGIVIHNVDFKNQYGETIFAKIVRKEYKHQKHLPDINKKTIEEAIVEKFCTTEFIEKEYAKVVHEKDGWKSKYIGFFLGQVYHTFITEEAWHFVKAFRNPTIDFGLLNRLVVDKCKEVKSELFC